MSSKHIYSTCNLTDLQLKEQGNCLFSARKYDDAINCYTKAIVSLVLPKNIALLKKANILI